MIGKLAARDSGSGTQFKPQIYQDRRRGQNRGSYDRCSYDQQLIKIDIGQIVEMVETRGVQAIIVPDQDQGLAQTKTESDVTSIGNMIISQRTVLPQGKEEN